MKKETNTDTSKKVTTKDLLTTINKYLTKIEKQLTTLTAKLSQASRPYATQSPARSTGKSKISLYDFMINNRGNAAVRISSVEDIYLVVPAMRSFALSHSLMFGNWRTTTSDEVRGWLDNARLANEPLFVFNDGMFCTGENYINDYKSSVYDPADINLSITFNDTFGTFNNVFGIDDDDTTTADNTDKKGGTK